MDGLMDEPIKTGGGDSHSKPLPHVPVSEDHRRGGGAEGRHYHGVGAHPSHIQGHGKRVSE